MIEKTLLRVELVGGSEQTVEITPAVSRGNRAAKQPCLVEIENYRREALADLRDEQVKEIEIGVP